MALKHNVFDTDNRFSINTTTRQIKNESPSKTCLIQYDHNSERFAFEMPKEVEGHDMTLCDKVEVHYINIDPQTKVESKDVYPVDDLQISEEDPTKVIFSWLISRNATWYVGTLNFLIRFECLDDAGNSIYTWNTAVFTGISVSTGIYNKEYVVEQYADVLEKWRTDIQALKLLDLKQTKESTESEGVNIWEASFDDGTEQGFKRELKVRNGKDGYTPVKGIDYFDGKDGTTFTKDGVELSNVAWAVEGTTLNITTTTK